MENIKSRGLVVCALFAALTAALSQISLPIGPVPVNLATFSVLSAGMLLGAKRGAVSQTVYVLLGLCGLPVFSGFRGGPAVLAGPTGGYILGYMLAPVAIGFILSKLGDKTPALLMALCCGFLTYMTLGTGWFMVSTGADLNGALGVCVLPFLPGDALKIAAAFVLAGRLRKVIIVNSL